MTNDSFALHRFIDAQESVYVQVLTELTAGRKRSHWMWFIFPQIAGLGHSYNARYYAITGADEAVAYLQHPVLGKRLTECCQCLLPHADTPIHTIMGSPDDTKLRSSLTLFAEVAGDNALFVQLLTLFYAGNRDPITLQLLRNQQT